MGRTTGEALLLLTAAQAHLPPEWLSTLPLHLQSCLHYLLLLSCPLPPICFPGPGLPLWVPYPPPQSSPKLSTLSSSSKVCVSAVTRRVTNNLSLITKVLEFVGDFLFKCHTLDSCRVEASFLQRPPCSHPAVLQWRERGVLLWVPPITPGSGSAHSSVRRQGSSSSSPRGATLQRQH